MNRRYIGAVQTVAVMIALLFIALTTANAQNPQTWTRWEQDLFANNSYSNPYKDVKIRVTYTRINPNDGTSYIGYAYWHNGNNFKIRTAFPKTGTWMWQTTCELGCAGDGGLNTSSTVNVDPYTGSNKLYAHGFLKVATRLDTVTQRRWRYFVFDDGLFFNWHGDTAWAGPTRGTTFEWNDYLNDRSFNPTNPLDKKFSVIQIALPVDWMKETPHVQPTDEFAIRPFVNPTSTQCAAGEALPCGPWRMNHRFWQTFDAKVQAANNAGFVVVIVGLMERLLEGTQSNPGAYPTTENSKIYARNIVARYSGNHVIFSPGFDRQTTTALVARMKAVGAEIAATSPRHLATNHFARDSNESLLHNETWLQFQMFQSGQLINPPGNTIQERDAAQLQEITRNPRTKSIFVSDLVPYKPVVNGEAIYDCGQRPGDQSSTNYNPYRVRQAGYLSLLSGSVGYTYGTFGIIDWGASYNPPGDSSLCPTYRDGLLRASNQQMLLMRNFFISLRDEPLVPEHTRIANQVGEAEQHRKMVLAVSISRFQLVAYLPNNSSIRIDFNGLTNVPRSGLWFNPRTGGTSAANALPGTGPVFEFTRPGCGGGDPNCSSEPDWVLLLGQ